jgi:hypothetical protein
LGQKLDNAMFFNTFLNMACGLLFLPQSRNNNNRPNKKNDVITDLGGEGNFPMFLSRPTISPDFPLAAVDIALAGSLHHYLGQPFPQWIALP